MVKMMMIMTITVVLITCTPPFSCGYVQKRRKKIEIDIEVMMLTFV